jgi:acyl transferase domain-containing protein
VALLRLLDGLGITADLFGGHSFGELAALHAAGAYDARTLLRLARRHGELMKEAANGDGAMLSVVASPAGIAEIMDHHEQVWIANHNAPGQVVLAGAADSIVAVEAELGLAGVRTQRLNVATAFHSPIVAGAVGPLHNFLDSVDIRDLNAMVYANETAAAHTGDADELRARIASQVSAPVRFAEQIEAMYAAGARTFVEVGPGNVLSGLVNQALEGRDHVAVALDVRGHNGVTSLHEGLAQLIAHGVPCHLAALWTDTLAEPEPEPASAAAVEIFGTNYGRPYPPERGAAALPKPVPEPSPAPIAPPVSVAEPVTLAQPAPAAQIEPVIADPRNGLQTNDAWLAALLDVQRTTAAPHESYQQSMWRPDMLPSSRPPRPPLPVCPVRRCRPIRSCRQDRCRQRSQRPHRRCSRWPRRRRRRTCPHRRSPPCPDRPRTHQAGLGLSLGYRKRHHR